MNPSQCSSQHMSGLQCGRNIAFCELLLMSHAKPSNAQDDSVIVILSKVPNIYRSTVRAAVTDKGLSSNESSLRHVHSHLLIDKPTPSSSFSFSPDSFSSDVKHQRRS